MPFFPTPKSITNAFGATPQGLKNSDGTSNNIVTAGAQASTGLLSEETRLVFCRIDAAPGGNRALFSQAGGGACQIQLGTSSVTWTRDFTGGSNTDATATASYADLACAFGAPWFVATTLSGGVPRLYGGDLCRPILETSTYSTQTTGDATVADKTANDLRFLGSGGSAQGVGGVVWVVAIWDYALSVGELQDIQRRILSGDDLSDYKRRALAWWEPGKHGYGQVIDESGHGLHASISGSSITLSNQPMPRVPAPGWYYVDTSTAVTGSLSVTLGALTASATGTVAVQGALSATLGSLTSSATGTVAVQGSLSSTLGALTATGTGTVAVQGSLSASLGALTATATGTVTSGPTGELTATLGALTGVATGTVAVQGAATVTLGTLTVSATGAVTVQGSATVALGAVSVVATGTVTTGGAQTFGNIIVATVTVDEVVRTIRSGQPVRTVTFDG